MILVYIVCSNENEAKNIAEKLLKKRLCACVNILDKMKSMYFWPAKSGKIEKSTETILLVKTIKEKYFQINKEILKIHSYDIPCIFSIKIDEVDSKYYRWLKDQIK